MSALTEFYDTNLHRSYPMADSSIGMDRTGTFSIPSALLTDIFMCVHDIPSLDVDKFYIYSLAVRGNSLSVEIGYDSPQTPDPLGIFKNIPIGEMFASAIFQPYKVQESGNLNPLYFSSGQLICGDTSSVSRSPGFYTFSPTSTYLVSTRMSKGLLALQHIVINDTVITGKLDIREGSGIDLSTVVEGATTTLTISLDRTVNTVSLASDEDVIDALTTAKGSPVRTINGRIPDSLGNISLVGDDCTEVGPDPTQTHGILIKNPCATPCCDTDADLARLKDNIDILNNTSGEIAKIYEEVRETGATVALQLNKLGNTAD